MKVVRLSSIVLLWQIFHSSIAQDEVPAIALTQMTLSVEENGGSGSVCVSKRSGTIPTGGLTVELQFLFQPRQSQPIMGTDYFVSSDSVSFAAGASDGEESCITITAICDNEVEGTEVATVQVIQTEMFTLYDSGNGVLIQTDVTIVDSTETGESCPVAPPSPPRNLRQTTPHNTPSATIVWDTPAFSGGNGTLIQGYRITIPAVMGYSEEESGTAHTITADGSDVMFNTLYDVEVTAVNTLGNESSPATIDITISATEPPIPTDVSATLQQCSHVEVTWMYGTPADSTFSPSIENVTVTYTRGDGVSGIACLGLTTSATSCVFELTIYQSLMSTFVISVEVTNSIGTSTASTSILNTSLSPPWNLRQSTPEHSPTRTIEWDAPLSTGGNEISYKITIVQVSVYYEEEIGTAHTITADGSDVMFNTLYDVEVTVVNICGQESSPASITVNITASEPPLQSVSTSVNCFQVIATWTYGTPGPGVYSPSIESVDVTYRDPGADGVSETACSGLTTSPTSCVFTIPQPGMYTVSVEVTNSIGTTTASTSLNVDVNPPSPPENIRVQNMTADSSIAIEWDAPEFTGRNEAAIATYRITIPAVMGYSEEESGTAHTITADGSDVMFNTLYDVEVTAVNTCGQESSPASITVNITTSGDGDENTSKREDGESPPVWVWPVVAVIIVIAVLCAGTVVLLYCYCKRRSGIPRRKPGHRDSSEMKRLRGSTGSNSYQDSSSLVRTPHPETGQLYTEIRHSQSSKKPKNDQSESTYQDPNTIEHKAAESGDLYAMPQGKKKRKKTDQKKDNIDTYEEVSAAVHTNVNTAAQNQHPRGLVYAELDLPASKQQQPSKPSVDTSYSQVQYNQ